MDVRYGRFVIVYLAFVCQCYRNQCISCGSVSPSNMTAHAMMTFVAEDAVFHGTDDDPDI